MCAQVPVIGLSLDPTSNDAVVNDDAATSSIPTTTTAYAPTVVAAVLLATSAWLSVHTAPSDEPSLRSERDDVSGWYSNAKPVLVAGSSLRLSVF